MSASASWRRSTPRSRRPRAGGDRRCSSRARRESGRPASSAPEPPPDSDLVGIPLVLGMVAALAAVIVAFTIENWLGVIVLGVVLVGAFWLSYRVVSASDIED